MESVITPNFRITIPKAVRQYLGLKTGDMLRFTVRGDGAVTLSKKKAASRARLHPAPINCGN